MACEGGCVEWRGATTGGYGQVWVADRKKLDYVHRVIYETLVAPIPDGLVIDHLCKNRRCVNINHLEVVTRNENSRRGSSKLANTHCYRGHRFTKETTAMNNRGWRICKICNRANVKKCTDNKKLFTN